jgi:hypothetical protein
LYATGESSGWYGHASFSVTPRLILMPNTGTPNGITAVQGYGYGAGETVKVYWFNPRVYLGQATADAWGSFLPLGFTVPAGAPLGTNLVVGKGSTTLAIGTGHLTVQ